MSAADRWPSATLGPIARARAIAAAVPSAAWAEGILDSPYDATWAWISDLEVSVPRFDAQVHKLELTERRTEDGAQHLRMRVSSLGIVFPFEGRLEPGYCLMQARRRLYLVVMAAEPHDEGRTRFFHLEAVPLPGTAMLRRYLQRAVSADLAKLTRLAAQGF
jgi:hypothetical protein